MTECPTCKGVGYHRSWCTTPPRPAGDGGNLRCWCEPTPDQAHPWKPWEINLCDPDGVVRRGAMHHGADYQCTGHAHWQGYHIRCTTPIHRQEPLPAIGWMPEAWARRALGGDR